VVSVTVMLRVVPRVGSDWLFRLTPSGCPDIDPSTGLEAPIRHPPVGRSDLLRACPTGPWLSCPPHLAGACRPTPSLLNEATAMTTMAQTSVVVTGGVEVHLDVHVAAALDGIGGQLGVKAFPTTPAGYRRLLTWLASFGTVVRVGGEATAAGLAVYLAAEGIDVVEVDRPNRLKPATSRHLRPCRRAVSRPGGPVRRCERSSQRQKRAVEAIRVLPVARAFARHDRNEALNQIRSLISTAADELREQLRGLSITQLMATAAALRPDTEVSVMSATKTALRELAHRAQYLAGQIARLDDLLTPLVADTAAELVACYGVGRDTAGALLVAAGDNPARLDNESAFAHLCGVAPIEASSGNLTRHRLNRGGDRQANHALWRGCDHPYVRRS
jgi:transposase